MSGLPEERIVMTPKKKTPISTTLKMERKRIFHEPEHQNGDSGKKNGTKVHIADGSKGGFVVNKQIENDDDDEPPHLSLEFRVFLKNSATGRYAQELRIIGYWFKDDFPLPQQPFMAQDFFKKLVSPVDFPRDYVGFIKKVMKLMQVRYPMIARIEIEMTQEMEMTELPNKPIDSRRHQEETSLSKDSFITTTPEPVRREDILVAIEDAYPNSLTIGDLARFYKADAELVRQLLLDLVERKLVKPVGRGTGMPTGSVGTVDSATCAFRRVHNQDEENVTIVKNMPRGLGGTTGSCGGEHQQQQPTIAIITSHYFENMAVDAVMTNKQTFVRYATVGEANIYTLGDIGSHRVVSTKLPMTGRTRDALIATGSTTTRLLGTFQAVEHVFLVGVAGAVPHYTDSKRHVRLGDVVLSAPSLYGQRFIYQYCEGLLSRYSSSGKMRFETKSWCPSDLALQEIALSLVEGQTNNKSWLSHYSDALAGLGENAMGLASQLNVQEKKDDSELSGWLRPSPDTDKLYMHLSENDVIEVGHPTSKNGADMDQRLKGEPVLHIGPIGAGRKVALDDLLRQEFSSQNGILAFDDELDAVVESIYGNRKERYMLIRGIADYKDGTCGRKDWQQYAALMAASVLKTMVEHMQPTAAV